METSKLSFEDELAAIMRTVQFASGEFFHIYDRGVDKRKVFMVPGDYERFLRSMEEFNDANHSYSYSTLSNPRNPNNRPERKPLVRVLAYCLMPNHYHFFLEQLEENGITRFMHRLGTGYTKFFNIKYERTGRLFESTFKGIHIATDQYFFHLSRYIHLNPVDLLHHSSSSAEDFRNEIRPFLGAYPWSSLSQYLRLGFHGVVTVEPDRILSHFSDPADYERFLLDWSQNKHPVFKEISSAVKE